MLAEMAMAFPIHVLVTLGILQLGFLSIARAHAKATAFAAARSALVETPSAGSGRIRQTRKPDPARAARMVLLPVTGTTLIGPARIPRSSASGALARVGGLARIADPVRLAAAEQKTRVEIRRLSGAVRATVRHDFELTVPGVGRPFAWAWVLAGGDASAAVQYGVPHIRIEEQCELRKR